ncbi:hypothetical protein AAVH_19629 [Aphelenchoides avenae]|nr:hypothetical protein AAVH_19629 [Aphelenchus avenae]
MHAFGVSKLADLKATFEGRAELRVHLHELAQACCRYGQWGEALEVAKEALGGLNRELWPIYAINALLMLSECSWNLGDKEEARKYSRKAAECHRIQAGSDKALFKEIFVDPKSPIDF